MDSLEQILSNKPLTRKQRTILDAVLFLLRKGELPTVREVGELVGLRSPATVLKHLRVLVRAGLISLSGKSRGIRIASDDLLRHVLEGTAREGAGEAPASDEPGGAAPLVLQSHLPHSARLHSAGLGARYGLAPEISGRRIALVGAIAAGQPFQSYTEGFQADWDERDWDERGKLPLSTQQTLPIDPLMFATSGEVFALRIEGDSMENAGILDGDYVIVRRQNTVEEGEIAAVLVDGEGTLKRWTTRSSNPRDARTKQVRLLPANERFDPIEITEAEARDVLVLGKYIGLVRGDLQLA